MGFSFSMPTMRLGFRCAHDGDSAYSVVENFLFGKGFELTIRIQSGFTP